MAGAETPAWAKALAGAATTSAGSIEEGHTRGLKLCPSRVLTIPRCLDLGRDGEDGRISSSRKEME